MEINNKEIDKLVEQGRIKIATARGVAPDEIKFSLTEEGKEEVAKDPSVLEQMIKDYIEQNPPPKPVLNQNIRDYIEKVLSKVNRKNSENIVQIIVTLYTLLEKTEVYDMNEVNQTIENIINDK